MATLWEMDNDLGLEDVYDMIEIINVAAYNRRLLQAALDKE